jgi:hypothetical protein
MLTKQLQVLIDVSLSSGRSFDDIRSILKIQGFGDTKIDEVFAEYRAKGQAAGGKEQVVTTYMAPPSQQNGVPASPVPSATVVPTAPTTEDFEDVVIETETPNMSEAVTVEVSSDFIPETAGTPAAQTPVSFETPIGTYTPTKTMTTTPTMVDIDDDPFAAPPQTFEAPVINPQHTGVAPVMPAFMAEHAGAMPQAVPQSTQQTNMQGSGQATAPAQTPAQTPVTPQAAQVPDFSASLATPAQNSTDPTAMAVPTFAGMPKAGGINVGLGGIPELENAALEDYKRKQASSPVPLIITLVVVVALIAGAAYWFFALGPGRAPQPDPESVLNRTRATSTPATANTSTNTGATASTPAVGSTTAPGIDPFTGQPFVTE